MGSVQKLVSTIKQAMKNLNEIEEGTKKYRGTIDDRYKESKRAIVSLYEVIKKFPDWVDADLFAMENAMLLDVVIGEFEKMDRRPYHDVELCETLEIYAEVLKTKTELLDETLVKQSEIFHSCKERLEEEILKEQHEHKAINQLLTDARDAHKEDKENLNKEKIARQNTRKDLKIALKQANDGRLDDAMELSNKWKDIAPVERLLFDTIRLEKLPCEVTINKKALTLVPDDFKKGGEHNDLLTSWESYISHMEDRHTHLKKEIIAQRDHARTCIEHHKEDLRKAKCAHERAKADLKEEKNAHQKTQNALKKEVFAHKQALNGCFGELVELVNMWKVKELEMIDENSENTAGENGQENSPHVPRSPAAQQ